MQCVTKSKIIGNMMAAENKLLLLTTDYESKKNAWAILRKTFVTNTNLPIKYRLIVPHSSICSILRYGMRLFDPNKANYS